jgi:Cu/Zn superoxide dismutase
MASIAVGGIVSPRLGQQCPQPQHPNVLAPFSSQRICSFVLLCASGILFLIVNTQVGRRKMVVATSVTGSMALRVAIAAAVVAASVSACNSSSKPSATSTSPTAPAQATTTAGAAAGQIVVPLGNEPSGTVTLNWDPQTKFISARLQMAGLTPGSSHAMHIHQGTCANQGDILVPFLDVTADDHGAINTTVQSADPSEKGLAAGTLLNIHLASSPQLEGPGSPRWTPISCADINPAASTTLMMAPLPQFGNHPQSQAILSYDPTAKTLTVSARATGLVANSAHAAHIHLGSCESQGAVKYSLNDLVASSDGIAETTTVIQNVDQAPPTSGWYINVHLGSHDQIEKDGRPTLDFAPILCGNVSK